MQGCGPGREASSRGFAAAWQEETLLAAFVAAKYICLPVWCAAARHFNSGDESIPSRWGSPVGLSSETPWVFF